MVGKLVIERDAQTAIAELRDDGIWASPNADLESYLNSNYSPKTVNNLRDSGTEAVNGAARDMECAGYQVSIVLAVEQVVADIVRINARIAEFWRDGGWAPPGAATILTRSRLDRQVSLSNCLKLWLNSPTSDDAEGQLILAWANLGSLIEGTMKFFLSVWEATYALTPVTRGRTHKREDLDELQLEQLRVFFAEHVWIDSAPLWDGWIKNIQQRRNAIHAYKDRDIGSRSDFFRAVIEYHDFLKDLHDRIPYPD